MHGGSFAGSAGPHSFFRACIGAIAVFGVRNACGEGACAVRGLGWACIPYETRLTVGSAGFSWTCIVLSFISAAAAPSRAGYCSSRTAREEFEQITPVLLRKGEGFE